MEIRGEKELHLQLSGIVEESVVDGPGIRLAIFVQGCRRGCPGCHNPQTHDPAGGRRVSVLELAKRLGALLDTDRLITGVTFSGGEPLEQAEALTQLAELLVLPRGLDLMVYTGYRLEELLEDSARGPQPSGFCSAARRLLSLADRMVDGPFLMEERDLTLQYRGSRNQRYLDAKQSLARGRAVPPPSDGWDFS